jgi:hypothetical protein
MYYYGNFYRSDNLYNRKNAVTYALNYALTPNTEYKFLKSHGDNGGDCTNFVSQCMNSGGAPLARNIAPWWYDIKSHRWSTSWTVAHSLYWTLKVRGKDNLKGLKGVEVESMDLLELGDIIQYEDKKRIIYHTAMITAFTNEKGERLPLISQHSYNERNITYVKPKAKKMHLMKIVVT